MADIWEAKGPTETVERRWPAPVASDDNIASVSAVGTGVTVSAVDYDPVGAIVTLSGGAASTTATVVVTVVTHDGETFANTFLIGIRAGAQQANPTAQDVVAFALRKITGMGETPDADQASDALERLNDMLAMWRIDGADMGLPVLALSSTLAVPDEFIPAIKFNLRVNCHSAYGDDISPFDFQMADASKRLVVNRLFAIPEVAMPTTLAASVDTVAGLF